MMNVLFGLPVSLGSVQNMLEQVSPELEPVVDAVQYSLSAASSLNIDETGWKFKGQRRYLWVFVAPLAASRGSQV